MAGKKRKPSLKAVSNWISRGYGQGEGAKYRPFLFVRDVPSEGTSSMVKSYLTGRAHHYLSKLEYSAHLIAEYIPSVIDIREQFALLPWSDTQKIASTLNIRHPTYPGTNIPIVMTTDLVLTLREADGVRLLDELQ